MQRKPLAGRAVELLDAVGVRGRLGARVPQIAATRREGVRFLDRITVGSWVGEFTELRLPHMRG